MLTVNPGLIRRELIIPRSKSIANRLLILSSLSNEENTIKNLPMSDDVLDLLNCLKQLGLEVEIKDLNIIIKNSFPECEKQGQDLAIREGGTTLRFLLALLSLGEKEYHLKVHPDLAKRPHDSLIKALTELGAKIELRDNVFTIHGPIKGNEVIVDCKVSSQFASALELISEKGKFKLETKNLTASSSFFELTKKVISEFKEENLVPVDMASLSYPLVYGLLNQEIVIKNVFEIDFTQPDAEIFKLFKKNIESSKDGLKIIPLKDKTPISFDMSNCLDMISSLSFFCSYLKGNSSLRGINNLIYKESNRLQEIQKILAEFNIEYEILEDTLIIHGGEKIKSQVDLSIAPDHRMIMTAYLFLKHNSGGTLNGTKAVEKSFPRFFKEMEANNLE